MKMKVQEMVERLMLRQLLFLKWSIALLMWGSLINKKMRTWRWRMVMRKQAAHAEPVAQEEVALVLYFGTAFR